VVLAATALAAIGGRGHAEAVSTLSGVAGRHGVEGYAEIPPLPSG
jgi:hypothetical protein